MTAAALLLCMSALPSDAPLVQAPPPESPPFIVASPECDSRSPSLGTLKKCHNRVRGGQVMAGAGSTLVVAGVLTYVLWPKPPPGTLGETGALAPILIGGVLIGVGAVLALVGTIMWLTGVSEANAIESALSATPVASQARDAD